LAPNGSISSGDGVAPRSGLGVCNCEQFQKAKTENEGLRMEQLDKVEKRLTHGMHLCMIDEATAAP
jgi:hypothetical protein